MRRPGRGTAPARWSPRETIGNITRPPNRSVSAPTGIRPSEPTTTGTATSRALLGTRRGCQRVREQRPERAEQRPGPEVDREPDRRQGQHEPWSAPGRSAGVVGRAGCAHARLLCARRRAALRWGRFVPTAADGAAAPEWPNVVRASEGRAGPRRLRAAGSTPRRTPPTRAGRRRRRGRSRAGCVPPACARGCR